MEKETNNGCSCETEKVENQECGCQETAAEGKCAECEASAVKELRVDCGDTVYAFQFAEVQFEITGVCNMCCEHCRAADDEFVDLDISQIEKVIRFVRKYSPHYKEVTVSGGEPFMHKQFREILALLRKENVTHLTLTTNGTFVDDDILDYISGLNFERVTFSISLDFLDPETHNKFRNCTYAYEVAVNAMKRIRERDNPAFFVSMRSTILPENIEKMESMVLFAKGLNLHRISFSSVLPSGRAKGNKALIMTPSQLTKFSQELQRLALKYRGEIQISSNEPLKWQARELHPEKTDGSTLIIDCCPAGTLSFNINSNGDMTPCSLLNLPMMNVISMTSEEIEEAYVNSPIVKALLTRSFTGKCGSCAYRCECGGCRVRAFNLVNDYLGEDPLCEAGPF